MTWVQERNRHEGGFHEVSGIELTLKEALEQGLLDQITEHVGDGCHDGNLLDRGGLTRRSVSDVNDLSRCPRCSLLLASQPTADGYLLASKLKLRVIAQVRHRTVFDGIRWD